jgi:hypothetical protein
MVDQVIFLTKCKLVFTMLLGVMFVTGRIDFTQKIDFSGNWILKEQKSITGTLYLNAVPKKIKVVQRADSFLIERINMNASREDIMTSESIVLDGKPFDTFTPSKRRKITNIKWEKDSQSLIEIAVYMSSTNQTAIEYKITDTWSLSADGKTLTMIRVDESSTEQSWSVKAIYDKQ